MEILRSVALHRLRTSLAFGGVVVGIMAITVTGALAEHFDKQFAGGKVYFGSSIQVADDAGSYSGVISLTQIDPIQRVPGVALALPTIAILAKPGSASGVALGLPDTVGYTDPRERAHSRLETSLARGRQLDPTRQGEVVLGAGLADEFGVRIGDRIALPVRPRNPNPDFVNHPFTIVGVLKPTGTLPDTMAQVGLLDAQLLLQESLPASFRDRVDPSALATGITVYGKPGVDLDRLADRINASVPGITATRPSDSVRNFDQGAQFTYIAIGTALLALAFGGLLVAGNMEMARAEREREIAYKMAFGAHAWHVTAECLVEAAAIGLAGGLVGFALGVGVAALLDLAGRSVSMNVFLVNGDLARVALGLAVVMGAGAGVVPALRAAQLDPDQALRAR